MCQARLNHCILLHVLRERTDSLLDTDIAKKFTERNERHKTSLNIWLSFLAFISFCENNVNFFITAMHSHTKTFSVFQCLSFCIYDNSKCKYVCDTKLYITVPSWAMPPPHKKFLSSYYTFLVGEENIGVTKSILSGRKKCCSSIFQGKFDKQSWQHYDEPGGVAFCHLPTLLRRTFTPLLSIGKCLGTAPSSSETQFLK